MIYSLSLIHFFFVSSSLRIVRSDCASFYEMHLPCLLKRTVLGANGTPSLSSLSLQYGIQQQQHEQQREQQQDLFGGSSTL